MGGPAYCHSPHGNQLLLPPASSAPHPWHSMPFTVAGTGEGRGDRAEEGVQKVKGTQDSQSLNRPRPTCGYLASRYSTGLVSMRSASTKCCAYLPTRSVWLRRASPSVGSRSPVQA